MRRRTPRQFEKRRSRRSQSKSSRAAVFESAVDQLIDNRMLKSQQMRWEPRSVRLLLQVRGARGSQQIELSASSQSALGVKPSNSGPNAAARQFACRVSRVARAGHSRQFDLAATYSAAREEAAEGLSRLPSSCIVSAAGDSHASSNGPPVRASLMLLHWRWLDWFWRRLRQTLAQRNRELGIADPS